MSVKPQLLVTYYYHSGFSCAMKDTLLIFDYWLGVGDALPVSRRITQELLDAYQRVVVFISHAHPDHLDPVVYEWSQRNNVQYVIAADLPPVCVGHRMKCGDELVLSDQLKVRAFDSTDLGVSFLVQLGCFTIFHAGDLNLWHWREKSTLAEVEAAEEAFRIACDPLMKERIDLSFFPLDPRQGRLFDAGANYWMMGVKPRLLIPMHFWGKAEVALEYARRASCWQTEVIALTRPGEKLRIERSEDGHFTVHLLAVPEPVPDAEPGRANGVALGDDEAENPFVNTDMPIHLDD